MPRKRALEISERKNDLIVVQEGHKLLSKSEIIIKNLHLINNKDKIPSKLSARIRHLGKLYRGKLIKRNNKFVFTANSAIQAVAEGQYLVLYNKDICLGGAEIRLR